MIPIDSARTNPSVLPRALECIAATLYAGELVCLFPKGRLTQRAFRVCMGHRYDPIQVS